MCVCVCVSECVCVCKVGAISRTIEGLCTLQEYSYCITAKLLLGCVCVCVCVCVEKLIFFAFLTLCSTERAKI